MENKRDITPITISYNAVIKRIDRHTGEVLDVEKIHNLVVTAGKERIRDYIAGLSTVDFSNIAIGEGTTASNVADTALETEAVRAVGAKTYPASNQVKYSKVFSFASGESFSITEAGLVDSAVELGSVLLNRLVFAVKAVDVDTDLSVAITITIN